MIIFYSIKLYILPHSATTAGSHATSASAATAIETARASTTTIIVSHATTTSGSKVIAAWAVAGIGTITTIFVGVKIIVVVWIVIVYRTTNWVLKWFYDFYFKFVLHFMGDLLKIIHYTLLKVF